MELRIGSHRYAEAILKRDFADEWHEILEVVSSLSASSLAAGHSPAIDPSGLEATICEALTTRGWTSQPSIMLAAAGEHVRATLCGDVAKHGVFVEVCFEEALGMYRDLFKLQVAGSAGPAEVGVIVVGSSALAAPSRRRLATFDDLMELERYRFGGIALPIAVIGLEPSDASVAVAPPVA